MKALIGLIFLSTPLFGMFFESDTGISELNERCSQHNIFTFNSEFQSVSSINYEKNALYFNIEHLQPMPEKMKRLMLRDFKNIPHVKSVKCRTNEQTLEVIIRKEYFHLIKRVSFTEGKSK